MINKLVEKIKDQCAHRCGTGSDVEVHPGADSEAGL